MDKIMKNIFRLLCATITVLAAASCEKCEITDNSGTPEGILRTITCCLESSEDTKGTLDGTTPTWEVGDKIWISNGTESQTITLSEYEIDEEKNIAYLSTYLTGSTLYAVYPASAQNGVSDGKIGIKIPVSTNGSFSGGHIAVAQGDITMSFKNAVTLFKITTADNTKTVSVASTSPIAGNFNVTYGGTPTVEAGSGTSNSVSLTPASVGDNYVATAPGVQFSDFTFTATNTDDEKAIRQSTKSTVTQINTIYPIGAVSGWRLESDATLSGTFTVNDSGKRVKFSRGNLYGVSTYGDVISSYHFEDNQYSFCADHQFAHLSRLSFTTSNFDLYGYTWRLMSASLDSSKDNTSDYEWDYLLFYRTVNGGNGDGHSYVNYSKNGVTIDGVTHKGAFLFPDGYSGTTDMSTLTWAQINTAGIVFLPAVGYQLNGSYTVDYSNSDYWSSTQEDMNASYVSIYYSDEEYDEEDDRIYTDSYLPADQNAIRLVRDV